MSKSIGIQNAELEYGERHLLWKTSKEDISNIIKNAERNGVKIICIAAFNNFLVQNKEKLGKEIKLARQAISLANDLDVPIVRLLADHRERNLTKEELSQVVGSFKKVGLYAKNLGVKIGIENYGKLTILGNEMISFLGQLDEDTFGILYDPANIVYYGQDPIDFLTKCKERILLVHLKDCKKEADGSIKYCVIGEGIMDYNSLIEELMKVYVGYCLIEYPYSDNVV